MAIPYLQLVIQFSLSVYALHTYLDIRQLKVTKALNRKCRYLYSRSGISSTAPARSLCVQALQRKKPPPQLADHLTDEQYKKAQAYNIDKW